MKVLKGFLIIFLINRISYGSPSCEDGGNCDLKKSYSTNGELKELRYAYLKKQILEQLNINEPPKTSIRKPHPDSLLIIKELEKNDPIVEIVTPPKTENIAIYPRNGSHSCRGIKSKRCKRFQFAIPENRLLGNFVGAEVWIQKRNAKGIRVYQVLKDNLQNSLNIDRLYNAVVKKSASSWRKYTVHLSSIWFNSAPEHILDIEVVEKKHSIRLENIPKKTKEMPVLVIRSETADEKGKARKKRQSATCTGSDSSCCTESFYIDFSEVGWDNWIIHPHGYYANFCRGHCYNDVARFYHSTVLLSFINGNERIAENLGLSMCCTPSVMAPITIFYRDEEQLIFMRRIDNMRVIECDCA